MIVTLDGELRGIRERKTKEGKTYFINVVEIKEADGVPELIEVLTTKNTRKLGPNSYKCTVKTPFGKGVRTSELRFSEV